MLVLGTVVLFAGGGKVAGQENFKWAEMESFHTTAMSSFHSAEINKLQPVKDSAAAIFKKAQIWQASKMPAGNDNATLKALLQSLVAQCKDIYDAVTANKPDSYLRPLVMNAHNTFHAIISKTK